LRFQWVFGACFGVYFGAGNFILEEEGEVKFNSSSSFKLKG
jgi:hypothetical protein